MQALLDRVTGCARALKRNAGTFQEAARLGSPRAALTLLGPAVRGLVLQQGKAGPTTEVPSAHRACFAWDYPRTRPDVARLTQHARRGQWDPDRDLDWSQPVDPHDPARELLAERDLPLVDIPGYRALPARERERQRAALLAWMLSQALHGEQGALFVACQLTEALTWLDGKLYGSTQVVDEGRHVEVFDRYLTEKLERRYQVNDNLFVVLDALMRDGRWDVKFLGMQLLVEGLALGAFGTLRESTREPLLRELLRYVITDEARHVHFGVVALQDHHAQLAPAERREREDLAFELCVLLRNRFLAHEFYDEFWAHAMSQRAWDQAMLASGFMARFRRTLFRRVVPNLKRIHLLPDRLRPHYAALGLLEYEHEKAAPDLTAEELVGA
ncbi:MAG: ferritin-like domain-containing protein [Planctomycetes bacterium]|nr:ferritin-like domain-containing protein [Planctomycetota bacterium]